jgi:hypothetical protein
MITLALWLMFALFSSSELYRRGVDTGNLVQLWSDVLLFQLSSAFLWAAFTPIVISIAERLPLIGPRRLRNTLLMLAVTPSLSVLRAVLGALAIELSEGRPPTLAFALLCVNIRFHRYTFLILVIVGLTNLLLAQRAAAARERAALALKRELANAEVQRLRAELQPRFLFATLDAVAAHLTTRPSAADRMLVQLGDLLRMVAELEKRGEVSLAEDLDVLDEYFEMEKTRSEGRFTSRVDVEEHLLDARVPPLLLHGLIGASLPESPPARVEIEGREWNGMLRLDVRLDGALGTTALYATRARLQQMFGDRASIVLQDDAGGPVTRLTMPLELPRNGEGS